MIIVIAILVSLDRYILYVTMTRMVKMQTLYCEISEATDGDCRSVMPY